MPRWRVNRRATPRSRKEWRRRRAAIVLAAMCAVLQLGSVGAEPAGAGTYVLRTCNVPGHAYSPLGPWVAVADSKLTVVDKCATGGGIGFRFADAQELNPSELAGLELAMPATGAQGQIKLVKVSVWYAARLAGTGQPLGVYSWASYSGQADSDYRMFTGRPGAESLSFEQELGPGSPVGYRVFFQCGPVRPPFAAEPCVAENSMPFQVRGMEVTLSEDAPPTVLRPAGTLLSGAAQSGVRTLSYAAADPESGLARVEVLLGHSIVETRDLTVRCFYSGLTVCPAADDDVLEIDTRAVPNGSYDLMLRVTDVAGNERVVHGDRRVDVANAPALESSNGASYALIANFKGSSGSVLTVPYGRRVSVRGRLTHGRKPVAAGTPIEILERLDRRGARERSMRTLKTKSDGSFSVGLATSRPSRVVRFAYRAAGHARVVSRALKLRVKAASRVRASLRGRSIRFNGRVLSGPMPKGGKRVQMEGRSPGSAWTPFKNLRTDKQGRFSGTYRLRVRRPGVVLKVRAYVANESGYGYLGSRSRAVTLRVR